MFQIFSGTVAGEETEEISRENRTVTFAAETADEEHDVAAFKMSLIGTDCDDTSFGPAIHNLITKAWSSIFTKGLSKDIKETLRKKYPVPKNLPLAKAPVLNLEVKQAIPSTSVKRDEYQTITQSIVEAAISAQAQLMTELLKPEDQWDSKHIFEIASDAGRLISHVQYHMSRARRALITPMLSASAKNALDSSPIDNQLFGEQYLSKMKDATAADRLVKSLTTQNTPATKPKTQRSGKTRFQTQGNAKAFVHRPTSRRGAKVTPRLTRQRSSSRSRSSHYPR